MYTAYQIDTFISLIKEATASQGILYIRSRKYGIKNKPRTNISALLLLSECLSVWKKYDYGKSPLCPITVSELAIIVKHIRKYLAQ